MLPFGLYDLILNQVLEEQLARIDPSSVCIEDGRLDPGDSHTALSHYIQQRVSRPARSATPAPLQVIDSIRLTAFSSFVTTVLHTRNYTCENRRR
jgi:hypothetical protein